MSWQQGHETVVLLINRGHLEQVSGEAANGDYLIGQARQRIATANSILELDRVEGETKTKLANSDVKSFVRGLQGLPDALARCYPAEANVIVRKAISSPDCRRMPLRSSCR